MYASSFTVTDKLELWLPILFFTLLWAVMQWHGKLPSTQSIQEFTAVLNSRGGNILVLIIASLYFFRYSMYIFLHLLNMVKDKTITQDNAFALMAIQFITTSAFGGAMGALLKTMTGESTKARSTDVVNGNSTVTKPVVSPVEPPKTNTSETTVPPAV
jgi:hypothetical protein